MDKQKILNIIIIIAIIALIGIVGWIIYDQKTSVKDEKENTIPTNTNKTENVIENTNTETSGEEEPEEEYIGQEETASREETAEQTAEEKSIQLAKKTWGEDNSVTFNIEEKKNNIYYVAVKSDATVLIWYEINTDTWEISEFY